MNIYIVWKYNKIKVVVHLFGESTMSTNKILYYCVLCILYYIFLHTFSGHVCVIIPWSCLKKQTLLHTCFRQKQIDNFDLFLRWKNLHQCINKVLFLKNIIQIRKASARAFACACVESELVILIYLVQIFFANVFTLNLHKLMYEYTFSFFFPQ